MVRAPRSGVDSFRRLVASSLAVALLVAATPGCRKIGGMEGLASDYQPRATGGRTSWMGSGGTPGTGGGATGGSSGGGGTGGAVTDSGTPPDASDVDATPPPPFSREALLAAAAGCVLSELRDFEARSAALADAVAALESSPGDPSTNAAAAAWVAAMERWQVLELMEIGPAAPATSVDGQDVGTQIYAWPQWNQCFTDQLIVGLAKGDPAFRAQFDRFPNVRGLGALEYLIFYGGSDNACSATNPINRDGTWAALGSALGLAKARYGRLVADDVHARATALRTAWEPSGGDFAGKLAHAGDGSSPFATVQAGLNSISDALFFLDVHVKDLKVSGPLGLTTACATPPCPELVESPYAGLSRAHVRNNLVGFRKLFEGCGGARDLGFDDLLEDVGQGELAARMAAAIETAIAAADAIREPSLAEALLTDHAGVQALYEALRNLSNLMKTDFLSVLNLGLPPGVGTDND